MALNFDRPAGDARTALGGFDRNAAAAVLAGASVPLIVLGPSAFQAPIAVALLLALPGRFGAAHPLRAPGWLIGFALVMVTWVPSLFTSILPGPSLFLFARTAAFIYGMAVIHALLAENPARHALFLKAFVATLAAMTVLALFSLFVYSAPFAYVRSGPNDHRDIPHMLKASTCIVLCALPVAAWAGWRLGHWAWRAAAILSIVAYPAFAVATDARASLAGLLVMGLVLCILVAWRRPRYLIPLVVVLVAGGAGIAWFVIETHLGWVEQEQSVAFLHLYLPIWLVEPHRQVIWRFVFERFLDRPLFGWGIGAINHVPGAHQIIPIVRGYYVPSHPHNWLLEILSETGIVGTLPLLALLAWWTWRLVVAYVREGSAAALALVALLVGFFGAGAFNFSIWRVWWHLTFMVLITAIVSCRGERVPTVQREPISRA